VPSPTVDAVTNSRLRRHALLGSVVATAAILATACSAAQPVRTGPSSSSAPTSSAPTSGTSTAPTHKPKPTKTKPAGPPPLKVHVTGFPDDQTVGVGMPIIADFNKKITSAKAFVADTKVTVNGKPADGAWDFEYSDRASGHVMEAHYREQNYWPAHAHIHVSFNLKGQSAGRHGKRGLVFDGKLTSLDFRTGARTIATVDQSTHEMTVMSDGKLYGKFPVSLGTAQTPTRRGVKVIMEQLPTVCMSDTADTYYECGIKWDQRLTYDGEYLHAAPWNGSIGSADLSNGCTNLTTDDAERLYHFMRIGDVVDYPNADGPQMQLGDGYGDWNVSWSQWQTGGALNTQA
jgi:lipoprotein-anchoring transpeptidase ErfK/SrfK